MQFTLLFFLVSFFFQVPSLFSYNNAVFTEEDWEGVSSLGISGKTKKALKVGRFGLGFKSVFHLTGECSEKI